MATDEDKLAKAATVLQGQSQQDGPRTPADLAISDGARPPREPAGEAAGPPSAKPS